LPISQTLADVVHALINHNAALCIYRTLASGSWFMQMLFTIRFGEDGVTENERSIADPTAACPLNQIATFEFLSQSTAEIRDSQHQATEIRRNTLCARHELLQ
jgi:hypothetical protein